MNYLPNKLLKLRKHYGYSQARIAKVCGVDAIQYMNYENGNEIPKYAVIKKLATFYHVNIDEIIKNDEKITLHDLNNETTDDLNLKYFTKKSITRDIANFIKRNKIVSIVIGCLFVLVIILFIIIGNDNNKPIEIIRENIDRLSVSSTNVVYIDNVGAVVGSGDNSNSQISGLPSTGSMKVCEGEGFTVILHDDGSVSSIGLLGKYADELSSWDNIIDIACGTKHIIGLDSNGKVYAIGDNENKQCDFNGYRGVNKIFATSLGSIIFYDDGTNEYKGSFVGSSSIKSYNNIIDLDSSDNILVILKEDGTVDVYTKSNNNFLLAASWRNIIDVACGNDFVAALDTNGKVYIDINHEKYKNEVSNWNNVICIAAANDYLVAYDGKTIRGVGKNSYNQFEGEDIVVQMLPQVSNIKISKDKEYLYVTFDGVANANGYSVSIDVGTGINKTIKDSTTAQFDVTNMQDNTTYVVSIVALGNENYLDSSPVEINYLFKAETDDSQQDEHEEDEVITIDEILGLTKAKFDAYLEYLGINKNNIVAEEIEDNICSGDEPIIVNVTGIAKGEKISLSEIGKRSVKYGYCKIEVSQDEEQQDLGN